MNDTLKMEDLPMLARLVSEKVVGEICQQLGVENLGELAVKSHTMEDAINNCNHAISSMVEDKLKVALTNQQTIRAIAKAVSKENRDFFTRVDAIKEILGAAGIGHDQEVFNCARLAMEEETPRDHIGAFVAREQANGNLPKSELPPIPPAKEEEVEPQGPTPDPAISGNAEEILNELRQLISVAKFKTNSAALEQVARNFARRKPANRTLSQLYKTVKEKCGDIFKK